MKEEKKLPPKSATSTPSKLPNDEILSSLLRMNNFDSISSIKDESLDIDLSACVPISADPMGMIGNSLSSTDFWRVLDESAQNTNLDMSGSDDNAIVSGSQESCNTVKRALIAENNVCIKLEAANSFSGTFLRPEPPSSVQFSPLKKNCKTISPEQQQRKGISQKSKGFIIKEEPPEDALTAVQSVIKEETAIGSNSPISLLDFGVPSTVEIKPTSSQKVDEPAVATNQQLVTPIFKCLDCNGIELTGQKDLAPHEAASHHILYKCNVCGNEFEQMAGLKKHIKTHRNVESRKDAWKKCPDCGKCLKLGSMWMHRKIHSDNKKYGCDICGQKFVQKINLTHHARIHTAEKPYECPECQKRFQERSHLQRHQKYHAQVRSYRCDKCGKMYKTERCLKVHNLVHLEQRPFACTVCDKSFISNSKLKQHSNIHTGERPFKCNYCPRDFTNFPNWLKHTRRRHKVDHKTGEHLENIPSYCSKKSSKTTKAQKNAASNPNTAPTIPTENNANSSITNTSAVAATPKIQVKRKKKVNSKTVASSSSKQQITNGQGSETNLPSSVNYSPVGNIATKPIKRERKQLMPKQRQKLPPTQPEIKREVLETKLVPKNKPVLKIYPDLHCLSITSAEELIMEQALEMEECGLYDTPSSTVNTDNAISSEGAAALHFKIKNEYSSEIIKEEEFVSLKDLNNRVLCSSLESSPYSSPASIELSTSTMNVRPTAISNEFRVPTFYVPPFTQAQGTMVTNLGNPMINTTTPVQHAANDGTSSQADQLQLTEQTLMLNTSTTHALINHLYLPMAVSMQQPNKVLPSVDTLLLSSHIFHNKGAKQTKPQHNLS